MIFYVYFCMLIVKQANCFNIFECEKTIEYVCNQKNNILCIDDIKMRSLLQQYKNYAFLSKCCNKCGCVKNYIDQTQQLVDDILKRKNELKHAQNTNISKKYLNNAFSVLKMETIKEKKSFRNPQIKLQVY